MFGAQLTECFWLAMICVRLPFLFRRRTCCANYSALQGDCCCTNSAGSTVYTTPPVLVGDLERSNTPQPKRIVASTKEYACFSERHPRSLLYSAYRPFFLGRYYFYCIPPPHLFVGDISYLVELALQKKSVQVVWYSPTIVLHCKTVPVGGRSSSMGSLCLIPCKRALWEAIVDEQQ